MSMRLGIVAGMGFVALAALLVGWLGELRPFHIYLTGQTPPGQTAYMGMRWMGLLGLLLLWAQLCVGALFAAFPPREAALRMQAARAHQAVGLFTLLVVALHPSLFIFGIFQRTQHWALSYMVPTFDKGYYISAISLGTMAFYLLLIGSLAAMLRRKAWIQRHWSKLHWINGAVLAMVTVHGLLIGGETRLLAFILCLTLLLASLLPILFQRFRPVT